MKKILIVEDDTAVKDSLTFILNNSDYATMTASNGKEAIDILKSGEIPDIVVMDIMMPEMDGVRTIEQMQTMELIRDIPIIVISGNTKELDFIKTVLIGPIIYIQKPFEPMDILEEIKRCLTKGGDYD